MFEELKQMNAELEELKKAHLEKSKAMFTAVAKKVFDKHPILESFSWTQYTPYFNDGDECVFSANIDYLSINDEEFGSGKMEEINTEYGEYDPATRSYPNKKETPNPDFNKNLLLAGEDAKEFLSNIDDSVLRDMFGDHVEVKVTRDGTEVEEYEHD